MADCSELRRLLAKIRTAPSQDHRDAIRRIAQLEAAIQELIEGGSSTAQIEKHTPDAVGEVEYNLRIHDEPYVHPVTRCYVDRNQWRTHTAQHHIWKALKHIFWYAVGNASEAHLSHAATRLLFALQLVFENDRADSAHYGVGRNG